MLSLPSSGMRGFGAGDDQKAVIEFGKPLTLITGQNGAGKTVSPPHSTPSTPSPATPSTPLPLNSFHPLPFHATVPTLSNLIVAKLLLCYDIMHTPLCRLL